MAKIQPYESQVVGNGIQDYQIKSDGAAYQGLENLGQGMQQGASKIAEAQESFRSKKEVIALSSGTADLKTKHLGRQEKMTQSFDMDAPGSQEKFFEEFDADKQASLKNVTSLAALEYGEKKIETLRGHLWEQARVKNAALLKEELGGQVKGYATSATTSAYMLPNMAMLNTNLNEATDFVSKLPGPDGHKQILLEQLNRSITLSSISGRILKDPEGAERDLLTGKYAHIDGKDVDQFVTRAHQRMTSIDREKTRKTREADTIKDQKQEDTFHDINHNLTEKTFDSIEEARSQGTVSERHADLLSGRLKNLVDGTQKKDPAVFTNAVQAIKDGRVQNFGDLMSQYGHGLGQREIKTLSGTYLAPEGKLSSSEKKMLSNISDKAAKAIIRPTLVPWGDNEGKKAYAEALTHMHEDYMAGKAAGKSASELLDETSKDYIGKSIPQYIRSKETLNAHAAASRRGESAVEYEAPIGLDKKLTPLSNGGRKATPSAPVFNDSSKKAFFEDFMKSLPKGKAK